MLGAVEETNFSSFIFDPSKIKKKKKDHWSTCKEFFYPFFKELETIDCYCLQER